MTERVKCKVRGSLPAGAHHDLNGEAQGERAI